MNRDVLSYGTVLAGSLFFMLMTGGIPKTDASLVSSAFFPRIVLGLLICLSALGLYRALRSGKKHQAAASIQMPFFIIMGVVLGYIVLLGLAGFVIATSTFLFTASWYMLDTDRTPAKLGALAAFSFVVAWGINYIFIEILMFILP